MSAEVTAFAPASVGNLSCGLDVLGLAVGGLGDRVTARRVPGTGIRLADVLGDGGRLPREAERNTASVAAAALLAACGCDAGVELVLDKRLPLASGLGSSGASAVAGAVAVDALLGLEAGPDRLLAAALEGERVACGAAHPDNVAPSLLGGAVLCRGDGGRDVVALALPVTLWVALVHPHLHVATADARARLPRELPLPLAIRQWGNVAGLVAGLAQGDYALIGRSLEDFVAEPARASLVPGLSEARAAAVAAGAAGAGLSGSGPTVFALCEGEAVARVASAAMASAFEALGTRADPHACPVDRRGARIEA